MIRLDFWSVVFNAITLIFLIVLIPAIFLSLRNDRKNRLLKKEEMEVNRFLAESLDNHAKAMNDYVLGITIQEKSLKQVIDEIREMRKEKENNNVSEDGAN